MTSGTKPILREHVAGGGKIIQTNPSAWRLEIPPGLSGDYRLAQLDDYAGLSRRAFPWSPPLQLSLRARASSGAIPGTWGFGLWNDPFGIVLLKGTQVRLPTLPNTAWFFFASPPNYLSLRDDLPGYGQLAAIFCSPSRLPLRLLLSLPLLPFVMLPAVGRILRRLVRHHVAQEAVEFDLDPTQWHTYQIDWQLDRVVFHLNGKIFQETEIYPTGQLGLVIWVDNQYASWAPDGRPGYGTLPNDEAAWLELESLALTIA